MRETKSFIYTLKSIKAAFSCFEFMSVWIISLYRKLELIGMNKLGKVWFHSTVRVKFHWCSVRNFISLKQLFLNWFWITASSSTKYKILTLQNQKVVGEKYFPTFLICKIKLQLKVHLNLLQQVRCFAESSIISSNSKSYTEKKIGIELM